MKEGGEGGGGGAGGVSFLVFLILLKLLPSINPPNSQIGNNFAFSEAIGRRTHSFLIDFILYISLNVIYFLGVENVDSEIYYVSLDEKIYSVSWFGCLLTLLSQLTEYLHISFFTPLSNISMDFIPFMNLTCSSDLSFLNDITFSRLRLVSYQPVLLSTGLPRISWLLIMPARDGGI